MGSATLLIASAADDIFSRPGYVLGTPPEIGNDDAACFAGFRYLNVQIPQGVTITSAHLHVRAAWNPGSFPIVTKVYCEAADTCATWVSNAHDPDSATPTTAYTDWSISTFNSGTWYQSPDITAAVHEVVNRPGWALGQALGVIIGDNGSAAGYYATIGDYAEDSGYAAYLDVTWGVPPTVTTAAISAITAHTATGGGTITNDGSAAPTAWGVCWSHTNPTPTLGNCDGYTDDA
jgi:hypothetical protein